MTPEELLAGVVLPIDKPRQWTSFQAVNKVKSAIRNKYGLKKFKIGHAGTLDPLATGLLLVCVGKATKRIDELQAGEKVYSGTMVLGATTPCFDMERAVDQRYPYEHITLERIREVLPQFLGDIQQVPPLFSAVKIDGQRAYRYARETVPGEEVPSPAPKTVRIAQFDILGFRPAGQVQNPSPESQETPAFDNQQSTISNRQSSDPQSSELNIQNSKSPFYARPQCVIPAELPQLDFRIRCGKGTYIRSIARDLGLALDSGAFLASLRREQVGGYTLADAIQLDEVINVV